MTRKMMFACTLSFVLGCCCTAFTMTCCWPDSTHAMTSTTPTPSVGSTETAWETSRSTSSLWSGDALATQLLGWKASWSTALDQTTNTDGGFSNVLSSTTTLVPWELSTTRYTQWDLPTAWTISAVTWSSTNPAPGTASWETPIAAADHTTSWEWTRATAFTG